MLILVKISSIFLFCLEFSSIKGDLTNTMIMSGNILSSPGIANIIHKECEPLIGRNLHFVCHGYYPPSVKMRYFDKHVDTFDAYSIFGSTDSDHLFITFGTKLLDDCSTIIISTPKEIYCDDWDIEFPFALMECIPFHVTIAEELLDECHGNKRVGNFTAMHYSDITPLLLRSGQIYYKNQQLLQLFLQILLIFVAIIN